MSSPAGEFIRLVLPGVVEVEADLRVDAETEVVVHLYDLTDEPLQQLVAVDLGQRTA